MPKLSLKVGSYLFLALFAIGCTNSAVNFDTGRVDASPSQIVEPFENQILGTWRSSCIHTISSPVESMSEGYYEGRLYEFDTNHWESNKYFQFEIILSKDGIILNGLSFAATDPACAGEGVMDYPVTGTYALSSDENSSCIFIALDGESAMEGEIDPSNSHITLANIPGVVEANADWRTFTKVH